MNQALKRDHPTKHGLKIPIHYVQSITGLPSSTLRNWEKRYQLFQDQSTRATFRRAYSIEDLCRLDTYARLTESGVTPAEIFSDGHPSRHFNMLFERAPMQQARHLTAHLQSALARRDLAAYATIFQQPLDLIPTDVFCEFVAEPILRRIGEFWHEGRLSIAEEHQASALMRSHLVKLVKEVSAAEDRSPVLLSAVEKDAHEGALLILRAILSELGIETVFLGSLVPVAELAELIRKRRFQATVLSLTHVSELALAKLAAALEVSHSPVFIGGLSAGLYPKKTMQPHINLLPATSASVFGRVLGKCILSGALV
jgi:DNA-binding transcriptional MerR regulator